MAKKSNKPTRQDVSRIERTQAPRSGKTPKGNTFVNRIKKTSEK